MSSSDYRPTNQHVEVQGILNGELKTHLARLDGLLDKELTAFNALLRSRNVPNVIVRSRAPISD